MLAGAFYGPVSLWVLMLFGFNECTRQSTAEPALV